MTDSSTKTDLIKGIAPLLILIAGVVVFAIFRKKPPTPPREDPGEKFESVQTAPAVTFDEPFIISVDGLTVPWKEVTIAAQVKGRITKKEPIAEAGRVVTPTTELLQIDKADYSLEVQRLTQQQSQEETRLTELQTELANVRELIKLAEEDVKLQEKELRRILLAYQSGSLTPTEKDKALRADLAARNALQQLKNQEAITVQKSKTATLGIDLIKTQKERAILDEERATVKAPIAGVVISDMVEEGDFVQPGTPLLKIEATEKIEVMTQMKLEDLEWIWTQTDSEGNSAADPYSLPALNCDVVYEMGGEEYSWTGKLSRIEGSGLDDRTRLVPVKIVVNSPKRDRSLGASENPSGGPPALVRGMYVTAKIRIKPTQKLVSIPETALRPGGRIWINRKGRLKIQTVDVASIQGDKVIIHSSDDTVRPGDEIVLSPLPFAADGLKLKTVTESSKQDESDKKSAEMPKPIRT